MQVITRTIMIRTFANDDVMKDSVKCAACNYLKLTNLLVCMLVVQCQTQIFRQKMVKETRTNVWKYFAYNKEETSRCLVQVHKQCGKLLKGKFAINLKKHKISTKEFEECDSKKTNRTVPEQEESQAPSQLQGKI